MLAAGMMVERYFVCITKKNRKEVTKLKREHVRMLLVYIFFYFKNIATV